MSKKSLFRGHFEKQHGIRAQTLFRYSWQHLYSVYWWLSRQLSWKKSFLLTWQILRLLVNTLAVDDKYPVLYRVKLMIPIQIQLSQKPKTFCRLFSAFSKSRLSFEHFEQKMTLIDFVFQELRTKKTWLDKCLKSPVSMDISTGNMVNGPKHCSNLHENTFIIFTDHCQGNWLSLIDMANLRSAC